jgi:hypothetical protein
MADKPTFAQNVDAFNASGAGSVTLDTTKLDQIAAQLQIKTERVLMRFALQVEVEAKQLAPIDTSALRNSIYTVGQGADGYKEASSAAEAANPAVQTEALPTPVLPTIAHVGPCVDYAAYLEFGTARMAAHPYLMPALEHQSQKLNDGSMWAELFT